MSHPNKNNQCVIGKQLEAGLTKEQIQANMRKWEQQCLDREGWYAHYVNGHELLPGGVNFHTHGLELLDCHPDFQIVVNCDSNTIHSIFGTLYNMVKEGKRFEHGVRYNGILTRLPVLMLMAYEGHRGDRQVLRVILPDAQGNLEKDKLCGLKFQYNDLLLTERVTAKLCERMMPQLYFRIDMPETFNPRLMNIRNEWLRKGFEARQEMERLINVSKHEYVDQNIAAQTANHYLNMILEFEQVKNSLSK